MGENMSDDMNDDMNDDMSESIDESKTGTTTASCRSAAACCANMHSGQAVELLNSQCFCISLQDGAMQQALKQTLASTGSAENATLPALPALADTSNTPDMPNTPDIFALIAERCPHLFSARPVFVSDSQTGRMAQVIQAIESVVALPAYRAQILAAATQIAIHDPGGAKGVFFGYDFHLHDDRIGLIEINTNAGGAMLNAVLARAQHACCAVMDEIVSTAETAAALETSMVDMFLHEWRLSGRQRPLRSIAIVDTAPEQQYLYPEFLLFQQLFQRHGLHAVIVDPAQLTWRDGVLWHHDTAIDLVYNRLTDFLLEAPDSAALRAAYLAHGVVLTPHPQAHALYADKRNLVLLTDPLQLQALGVAPEIQKILLDNIPHTELVRVEHAERLWSQRRHLFFKPAAGYGGRAAYRGDKLTKRVWQEILDGGDYIAQAIVTPGERVIGPAEQPQHLKFDLRSYTYQGAVQWTAARMYQGQTTNFRTPGGGFAPVYSIPDAQLTAGMDAISQRVASSEEQSTKAVTTFKLTPSN
ncbi:hypothetical protein BH11PSE12_BH11PSE12_23840 [soil metagenome]